MLKNNEMPKDACDSVIEKISDKFDTFPLPQKPSSFGESYNFPEDIAEVSSLELGRWMFKLAAWKGYALKILAYSETEMHILDDVYDTSLAKKMAEMEPDKLLKKEAIIGKALNSDEKLKSMKSKLIAKTGEVAGLKRLVEIYTLQIDVTSREISRRGQEIRRQVGHIE